MYSLRFYVDAGGLIPYSTDLIKSYRRAAAYVDKILRGARLGGLPVEQPTKFEDSGNLRDAILKMNHNTVVGASRVDRKWGPDRAQTGAVSTAGRQEGHCLA